MIAIAVALFLVAGILEILLMRLNWIGRKKLGMYESNRVWRWFDHHGLTTIACYGHFVIITLLLSFALVQQNVIALALVVGLLATNVIVDDASINRLLTCKRLCPKFKECMRNRKRTCYKIWDKAKRRLFR